MRKKNMKRTLFATLLASTLLATPLPPVPIYSTESDPHLCLLVDPFGNHIAVWEEKEMIMTSDLPPNGNWSVPVLLSNPSSAATSPQLEIDPLSGDATILWLEGGALRAASRLFGEEWLASEITPSLMEVAAPPYVESLDFSPPAPKRRLAIALTLPESKSGRKKSAPPKIDADAYADAFRPNKQADRPLPDSLSTNAFDAPSGGTLSGMQLGFAAGTSAPSGGAVISGQVSVGTSSIASNVRFQVSTKSGDSVGMFLTGTLSTVSGAQQFGYVCAPTISPTSSPITISAAMLVSPSFAAGGGHVIAGAYGIVVLPTTTGLDPPGITTAYGIYVQWQNTSAGTGTTDAYGIFADTFSFIAATNQYSGYFKAPTGPLRTNTALYTDNLSIGYVATTPPTNGAIISGQLGVGTSGAGTTQTLITAATTRSIGFEVNGTLTATIAFIAANDTYGQILTATLKPSGTTTRTIQSCIYTNVDASLATATTVPDSYSLYVGTGSLISGSVTRAYGVYVENPGYGTTKCAIYGQNLSIGYTATTPPTDGAIISGLVGVNTSSPATTNVVTSRLHVASGSISIDSGFQYNVRSDVGGSEASGGYWIGFNSSNSTGSPYTIATLINVSNDAATRRPIIFTTSSNDAITGTLTGGMSVWPVIGGVSIGRGYVTTIPPTDGAIISGIVGIGTASPTASAKVNISTTLANGVQLDGTLAGSSTQFGFICNNTFSNSGTNAYIASFAGGIFVATVTKTVSSAMTFYSSPIFTGNAGTITNAYGMWFDGGGTTVGTITNAYGGNFYDPNFGTTKIALYAANLSVGYLTTAPPTNGAIISGHVGIGLSSPNASAGINYRHAAADPWGIYLDGSSTVSADQYEYLTQSTLTPTNGASNTNFIYLNGFTVAPSTKTITSAYGIHTDLIWSSNVGTITTAYNCRINAGGGAGTITTGYGLYVDIPTMATTNYTAFFGGGGSGGILMDANGIYPGNNNKTTNCGMAGNAWGVVRGATMTAGTSRLARSQVSCPTCGEAMMRGTGTFVILGETGDYTPCWCCNDLCRHKGMMFMDKIKHLPPEKLIQRRPPPKIEFLGFKFCLYSGNSHGVRVDFKYIDEAQVPTGDVIKDQKITNSTFLSDVEYAEFITLTEGEQRNYLYNLGLREWYSMEECRLMKEECAIKELNLNKMVEKWINTDLMK
jgi:hypothetical protein